MVESFLIETNMVHTIKKNETRGYTPKKKIGAYTLYYLDIGIII